MKTESEKLLDREARAALPLGRQVLLYLDPFALFLDASKGSVAARQRALARNRAMRAMLLPYLRRWLAIAGTLLLGVGSAEAIAAQAGLFLVPTAALATGACLAFSVAACIAAAYLLLGAGQS